MYQHCKTEKKSSVFSWASYIFPHHTQILMCLCNCFLFIVIRIRRAIFGKMINVLFSLAFQWIWPFPMLGPMYPSAWGKIKLLQNVAKRNKKLIFCCWHLKWDFYEKHWSLSPGSYPERQRTEVDYDDIKRQALRLHLMKPGCEGHTAGHAGQCGQLSCTSLNSRSFLEMQQRRPQQSQNTGPAENSEALHPARDTLKPSRREIMIGPDRVPSPSSCQLQ